jgi:hypothetical protein
MVAEERAYPGPPALQQDPLGSSIDRHLEEISGKLLTDGRAGVAARINALPGLLHRTMNPYRRIRGPVAKLKSRLAVLTQETLPMSMQAHLVELERRHRALEAELADALSHPSTDDLKIAELKRRKLLVKDQMARLQQEGLASVH